MATYICTIYFLFAAAFCFINISEIQGLKCRSKEHMRQEEDFYNLVNKCMRELMNGTHQSNNTASFLDHKNHQAEQEPPSPGTQQQVYNNQHQQHQHRQHQQQEDNYYQPHQKQRPQYYNPHQPEHEINQKPNNYFNADRFQDSPYGTTNKVLPNKPNQDYLNEDMVRGVPNTCTCIDQEGHIHRYGYERGHRPPSIQYREKRNRIYPVPKNNNVRTNSTNSSYTTPSPSTVIKKSPLEEIGSCVIHCIFRELKMLNDENKVDRQAMLLIMTLRIRDPELKEFVEDTIDECYDILDTGVRSDNNEELCNFSKRLALCLEERAKRTCDDWEVRGETPSILAGVNVSQHFENYRDYENQYNRANPSGNGSNSPRHGFNRWNPNSGQGKRNK